MCLVVEDSIIFADFLVFLRQVGNIGGQSTKFYIVSKCKVCTVALHSLKHGMPQWLLITLYGVIRHSRNSTTWLVHSEAMGEVPHWPHHDLGVAAHLQQRKERKTKGSAKED